MDSVTGADLGVEDFDTGVVLWVDELSDFNLERDKRLGLFLFGVFSSSASFVTASGTPE